MRLTIEYTGKLVDVDGVPCGVWNGRTDGGASCLVFVWGWRVPADPVGALEAGKAIGTGRLTLWSGAPVETNVGECREWFGVNPDLSVCAYVRRIAVPNGQDCAEFDAAIQPRPQPVDWPEALALIHGG